MSPADDIALARKLDGQSVPHHSTTGNVADRHARLDLNAAFEKGVTFQRATRTYVALSTTLGRCCRVEELRPRRFRARSAARRHGRP
jgi:hypothetical protein